MVLAEICMHTCACIGISRHFQPSGLTEFGLAIDHRQAGASQAMRPGNQVCMPFGFPARN